MSRRHLRNKIYKILDNTELSKLRKKIIKNNMEVQIQIVTL